MTYMSGFHKDGHARFHHYQRRAHRFSRFRHSRHASGGNFKSWFWRRDGLFIAAAHAFGALPGLALSVLLPVFLLCDFYVGWKYYRRAVRRIVIVMTLAACLGQVWGWLLYKQINAEILMFIIGALAVFTAGRYFWRLYRPAANTGLARAAMRHLRRRLDRAVGWMGLAGIASFVSLTGGIPSQIYLLPLNLPRAYYVGTMGWSFLLVNLAKLPFSLNWSCLMQPA